MPETDQETLRALAAHGVDDSEAERPAAARRKERPGSGRHGYTLLSYNCKHNWHSSCFGTHCQCQCHPEVAR